MFINLFLIILLMRYMKENARLLRQKNSKKSAVIFIILNLGAIILSATVHLCVRLRKKIIMHIHT